MWKPAVEMAARVSRLVWQPPNRVGQTRSASRWTPGQASGVGLDVFEEAQLPTGPQHPGELGQGVGLVGHRAQR